MKFRIAAIAMAACSAAGAQSSVTLSGVIDLNVEHLKSGGRSVNRVSSGGLSTPRIAFSGQEDLGGGMKALFRHELQFNADTGVGPLARESYVGLSGSAGTLTLGRQNTPSYSIAGYADPGYFPDYGLVGNMQFFFAPFRENNSLLYVSPRVNGLQARAMFATGKEDGTKDGRYVSVGADYRNGPLFLGLVTDQKHTKDIFVPNTIGTSRDTYLSAAYKFGNIEPTAIFHTYNGYYAFPPFVDFNTKGWDLQLGARVQFNTSNRMFASYVHKNDKTNAKLADADAFSIGYIHSLSKRTDLYGTIAHIKHKQTTPVRYPLTFSSFNVLPNENPSGVQLGIRHTF